ncbi:hypothetical protein HHK36_011919 [Tetracentron sinense]|uniref:Uncharacterized protein n=1 Tax=Tetracentron sinense TaxID=13715 RepID=A0A835DHN8_TETSI|nr:hypothetical protein HHK36_011919 [Tetracentron sinense]
MNQETSMELPSNSTTTSSDRLPKIDGKDDGCSTPKGQRFRIPEILTCPPAPKKLRVASNCSSHRSPITFFAPPDLELFFFFALHGYINDQLNLAGVCPTSGALGCVVLIYLFLTFGERNVVGGFEVV